MNSPFVQTAGLLLQIPWSWPQGCAQVQVLPLAWAARARAARGQLQCAWATCQAAAKWKREGMGFAIPAHPPRAAPKPSVPHSELVYLTTYLPQWGFLSAREKPQHLSEALERGCIASSGATADKVWHHAKKQQQISVQGGRFSSTQRHRHAPCSGRWRGLSAPKAGASAQPDIPTEHLLPSRHSPRGTFPGVGQPPAPCPPQLLCP